MQNKAHLIVPIITLLTLNCLPDGKLYDFGSGGSPQSSTSNAGGNTSTTSDISSTGGSDSTYPFTLFENEGNEYGIDVVVDDNENIYILGAFDNILDLGCEILTSTESGSLDTFIAKFDSSGICQWNIAISGTGNQFPTAFQLAQDTGALFIAGTSDEGAIECGNKSTQNNADAQFAYYARVDSDGECIFVKHISSSKNVNVNTVNIEYASDISSNLLVGGSFSGTLTFPNGILLESNSTDGYLWRVDIATQESGTGVATQIGGDDDQSISSISQSNNGLTICGNFENTLELNGTSIDTGEDFEANSTDIFVLDLDKENMDHIVWDEFLGGEGVQTCSQVINQNETTWLTGSYAEELSWSIWSSTGTYLQSDGGSNLFTLSFQEGNPATAQTVIHTKGNGTHISNDFVFNADGLGFIAANYIGDIAFEDDGTSYSTSDTESDGAILSFDWPSGFHATTFTGPGLTTASGIFVLNDTQVIAIGTLDGQIDNEEQSLTTSTGKDVFLYSYTY